MARKTVDRESRVYFDEAVPPLLGKVESYLRLVRSCRSVGKKETMEVSTSSESCTGSSSFDKGAI